MQIGLFNTIRLKTIYRRLHSKIVAKKAPWKILFFGTDEFSLYSLRALCKEYNNGTLLTNLEVVTVTKGKPNPVKKYSEEWNLVTHSWPIKLADHTFDVGLVVSFGHLIPESVIAKFPLGMLNVHASLLPKWRGAAPIIHSLANGDSETGITIIRIRPKHFDIGEIVTQTTVSVSNHVKMPELYHKLGSLGAECLINCLKNLPSKLANANPQISEGITFAPKIDSKFSIIKWSEMTSTEIYNKERAVTGLFTLQSSWNGISVKLIGIEDYGSCEVFSENNDIQKPGFVMYDKKTKSLKVICANRTWISVDKVGVFGRKIMDSKDFNNGYVKKVSKEQQYFN